VCRRKDNKVKTGVPGVAKGNRRVVANAVVPDALCHFRFLLAVFAENRSPHAALSVETIEEYMHRTPRIPKGVEANSTDFGFEFQFYTHYIPSGQTITDECAYREDEIITFQDSCLQIRDKKSQTIHRIRSTNLLGLEIIHLGTATVQSGLGTFQFVPTSKPTLPLPAPILEEVQPMQHDAFSPVIDHDSTSLSPARQPQPPVQPVTTELDLVQADVVTNPQRTAPSPHAFNAIISALPTPSERLIHTPQDLMSTVSAALSPQHSALLNPYITVRPVPSDHMTLGLMASDLAHACVVSTSRTAQVAAYVYHHLHHHFPKYAVRSANRRSVHPFIRSRGGTPHHNGIVSEGTSDRYQTG